MKKRRTHTPPPAADRCHNCARPVAGHESVNCGSLKTGYRLLCWQCFNTEVAALGGLDKFEHVQFEPVRLVDCEGHPHDFHFRLCLIGPGVMLDAFELQGGNPAGYQFQILGDPEEDPFSLLGRLVEKIRRALAVKHLEQGSLGLQVAGQVVRGRFEWDDQQEGRLPVVVVDGREISWDHFGRMLMSFEGWQFRLQILDRNEEA